MNRLPHIDDVKKSIEILKKEKWPAFEMFKTVEEFKDYFHQKFEEHFNQTMLYLVTPKNNLELKFYRARPYEDIKDKSSTAEYSYPPKKYCTKNRANLPGFPVFYSSTSPHVALLETIRNNHRENKDKVYCLGLWDVRKKKNFVVAPQIFDVDNILLKDAAEKIINLRLRKALKNSPFENDWESYAEIIKYLADSFVRDNEENYSISSFIGHSHLYMPHHLRTDFFIYPSIQSDKKGVNVAINPNTVDEHLEMKYLLILRVTEIALDKNHIQYSISEYGVNDGNKINIKPVTPWDETYAKVLREFTPTL